jgi:SAM-dependent methyltransferase
MKDYYQQNYKDYHHQTFHVDPSSFLEPLVKYLPQNAFILDVGCGSGRDLCWFGQRGYKVLGFERSKALADLARKYAACQIIEDDFNTYDFSKLHVDAIILVGALVHVPHEKFKLTFKHITSGLPPDGKVLITLKQGEGTFTDDHGRIFFLWIEREIELIFSELGFVVLDFNSQVSKVRPNDVWLGYVLEKSGAL